MQTTTATHAGGNADLLSGILGVEIRNEEKITAQDRLFCEKQQEMLYNALEQIDQWYGIFTKEAEKYSESHKISYKENGEISYTEKLYPDDSKYSHHEFRPFKSINMLASANHSANQNFASRIIGYFNRTYNVSVPVPGITIRKHIETPTIKCNDNQQITPNLNYIDLLIFLSFLPSSTLLVHVVCYRTVKDSLTQFYLLR